MKNYLQKTILVSFLALCSHVSAVDVGSFWDGMEVDEQAIDKYINNNTLHAPKMLAVIMAHNAVKKELTEYDLAFHFVRIYRDSPTQYLIQFRFPVKPCNTCTFNRITHISYKVDLAKERVDRLESKNVSTKDYAQVKKGTLFENVLNANTMYAPFIPAVAVPFAEFIKICTTDCLQNYAVIWEIENDSMQVTFTAISDSEDVLSFNQYAEYVIRRSTRELIPFKTKIVGID